MPTSASPNPIYTVLLSLGLVAAPAWATPVNNDVMVVTASGYEQKITEAAASISVISQQELQQKKFNDVAEALSEVEGVDVRGSTGKTGGLDISLRGLPSQYTLILVDGIRQNGSSDVTPNGFDTMNTSFMPPMSAIERIEVIRGPMSTLYGSEALGGVINIITKKISPKWASNLSLEHTFQENRDAGDSGKVTFYSSGPLLDNQLGLAVRGSGFHRDASSLKSSSTGEALNSRGPSPVKSDNYDLSFKLTWSPTQQHALWLDSEIASQQYDNSQGQLGILTQGYKEDMRYERKKVVVGHDSQLAFGTWNSSLSWSQTDNKGRTLPKSAFPKGSTSPLIGSDRLLRDNNLILDTKLVTPVGESHLVNIGGQFWHEEMEDGLVMVNGGNKFRQNSAALFAEDEWRLRDDLALTYGARYEHHKTMGGHVSPRTYLVWNALEDWTVKGGVSTGYKTPSLGQLHNGVSGITKQGAVLTVGNPDLKPEKSVNSELGIYYAHSSGFNANATLFHNRLRQALKDETVKCTNPNSCLPGYSNITEYSRYINVDKAITQGVELGSTIPLWQDWSLNLNYTYTDSEQKGKNHGAKLTNTPEHMFNSKLNWQVTEDFATWLKMEYRGKMPRFTKNYENLSSYEQQEYDLMGKNYRDYTLLHLGAAYQISSNVTLNAAVNNLLDKDFSKFTSYRDSSGKSVYYAGEYFSSGRSTSGNVQQGRNYWMSVNVSF